jgi:hypothetical protein
LEFEPRTLEHGQPAGQVVLVRLRSRFGAIFYTRMTDRCALSGSASEWAPVLSTSIDQI